FDRAGWYSFFAGILDALDGGVARLSKTGTRFGAELDSLVDIVSFGVAPAFLLYQLEFASAGQAEWIFCYFYVMAAAIRLARFNITQAGRSKRYFIGLPSPAAGMTLATFYPFTTTELWHRLAAIVPRHHLMQFVMILLTILMVSNVRYATLPRAGLRSARGLLGLATVLFILVFGILEHDAFFFPLGITYMAYGILRATVLGFFLEASEDEEAEIAGPIVITNGGHDVRPAARQSGDRGLRAGRGGDAMTRVAVIVFPGSNCDADTLAAAREAGSDAYYVWHRDADLRQADVVVLPGGFSYGDYLRSGAIARFSPIMGAVAAHARAGGPVLGICN